MSSAKLGRMTVALVAAGAMVVAPACAWAADGGKAATSMEFYAGWYAPADASATPDTLELSLDKPAYKSGDTATLRLYFEDGGTVHYACEVNGQETPLDGSFPAAKSTWSGAKPALFARNTANRAGGQGRFGAVSFECL